MNVWDAIVVGAGPAGWAAAYDLAAAGHSVLLLDKSDFPRIKACAGGVTQKAQKALRYPITPVIRQTISRIAVERNAHTSATIKRRSPVCYMTVREELDSYCLKQTLARGARFERIGAITAIEPSADSVSIYIDGRALHARFLIGADGVHSRVRQLTSAATWFARGFAIEANIPATDTAAQDLVFDFEAVHHGYGWLFPKGDHINIGLYTEDGAEKLDRTRLSKYVQKRFGTAEMEHVVGQYAGFGAEDATPDHARIFLTGDAGGFVDRLTGEGIYGAIVSGQAAAEAIHRDLLGEGPAQAFFANATAKLRDDLRISTSAARWFYGNLDMGFRALTAPILRSAVLDSFGNGTGLASLARTAKRFVNMFAT